MPKTICELNMSKMMEKTEAVNGERRLTAINLLTRFSGVVPVLETDKGEALRPPRFSIFGQEDSCDAAEALEDFSEIVFFCHFRDLYPGKDMS